MQHHRVVRQHGRGLDPGAPAVLVRGEAAEQRRRVADSQRLQGVAQRGGPLGAETRPPAVFGRRGEVGVGPLGARARRGQPADLPAAARGVRLLRHQACFVAGPIVNATAALEIPARAGTSRLRTPSSVATRCRLALIASDLPESSSNSVANASSVRDSSAHSGSVAGSGRGRDVREVRFGEQAGAQDRQAVRQPRVEFRDHGGERGAQAVHRGRAEAVAPAPLDLGGHAVPHLARPLAAGGQAHDRVPGGGACRGPGLACR